MYDDEAVVGIVDAKVVVRGDTPWFDISAHEELNQCGLRLGLPRSEPITSNEHVVLLLLQVWLCCSAIIRSETRVPQPQ